MDSEPFSQVVLPPEKGTGIHPEEERLKPYPSPPEPKEYLLYHRPVLPLHRYEYRDEEHDYSHPFHTAPWRVLHPGESLKKPGDGIYPNFRQDYLITYEDAVIGCFHTFRPMLRKQVLEAAAAELRERIEKFDLTKHRLLRALHEEKLKGTRTRVRFTGGYFDWFGEECADFEVHMAVE
jgi:hypothetical protein